MAGCISLSGSSACPAWDSSSISTDSSQYGSFPWLKNVTDVKSFDKSLSDYVSFTYITNKYVDTLGCEGMNSSALNDYYARYTTSVICSSVVQSSIDGCDLSTDQSAPICADTCYYMAQSEEEIVINSELCSSAGKNYMDQIRSDFEICAHPSRALTGSCVDGATNEPENCGYGDSMIGLCTYCTSTSGNSTDTCCKSQDVASQCSGVTIPSSTATLQPVITTSPAADAGGSHGLSGGAIAGAVVGAIAGAAILIALIVLGLICCRRRRRDSQSDAALNAPNPQRKGASPPMQQTAESPQPYNIVPGGRVTRMSALREVPSSSPAHSRTSAAMFAGAKYASDSSDSEYTGASPGAMSKRIPPVTGKRHGSLSSSSVLAGLESDSSPRSGTVGQYSSPEGVTSGQSEQLSFFRDYYSQDDIHPGDQVAVLWAYSARAGDEFELDRGEMLKVIGIWDDGWATGVRIHDRAEDFDTHRAQRDSGVSNGSHRAGPSPAPSGEIKAFPLVCICLPQHWRKIIDGSVLEEEEEDQY